MCVSIREVLPYLTALVSIKTRILRLLPIGRRMLVIRALLFSYWLLVALPHGTEAAAIASSPVNGVTNSTLQREEPAWTNNTNSTNSSAMCPPVKMLELDEQRRVRLANIKAQIMAKFGLTEPPPDPGPMSITEIMDEQTMSAYHKLLDGQAAIEAESIGEKDECGRLKGKKSDFYAKELRVHFPSSYRPIVPSVYMFEWGSLFKLRKRRGSDGKNDAKPPEKEASKVTEDNGDTNLPGSSEGLVTTVTDESPTVPVTGGEPRYSEAEIKVFETYVAPLVYKLTFSDLALSQSEISTALSAELRLFKKKKILDNPQIKQDTNPTEKVEIFQIWNMTNGEGVGFRFVTSENVGTERDEFVAFNVTSAIKAWQREQNLSTPLSFEVHVRSPQSVVSGLLFLPSIEFDVPNFGKGEHNAQLLIAVPTVRGEDSKSSHQSQDAGAQHSGNRRRKRQGMSDVISNSYCRRNPNETNCCIHDLVVDFHRDLNMTWILAPRAYQVNYCEGSCPAYWSSATHSTTFLNEFREKNPLSSPEPCCVAATTSPLTMVVVVNQRLYFNFVPDMVVTSCICR